MVRVLHWNGSDVPEELQKLPAGRYILHAADDLPALSAEQEAGLRSALRSLESGQGASLAEVRARITSLSK